MRETMRTLLAVAVLAGISLGQGPLELLASERPVDQAWGAYRAGGQQIEAAVPALRRLLKSENAQVRARVLDALIRLRARVGLQELEPLYERRPDEVLILLALHPVANRDALLGFVAAESSPRLHWTASCNLLATEKDPDLAALLLDGMTMQLAITVSDTGFIGLGGGGGGSMSRGRRGVRIRAGWPPLAVYGLTERQGAGAEPFAPGLRPVFYTRRVIQTRGGLGTSRRRHDSWKNGYRFEYLAHLLGQPTLPIFKKQYESIRWESAADYTRRAHAALKKLKADYAAVLDSLVEKKLLDPDDRKEPDINVVVRDLRTNPETPPPQISR